MSRKRRSSGWLSKIAVAPAALKAKSTASRA
jgi:hypothetical protein